MESKSISLLEENSASEVVADSVSMLRTAGFDDDYIWQFTSEAISILNDYAELIGVGTPIEYTLAKRFARVELRVLIPGAPYDPFVNGGDAGKRKLSSVVSLNLNTETTRVAYKYALGCNIISVSAPLTERRKSLVSNPVTIAVIAGIILGLLCQHLPERANSIIVDELASPLMSILLKALSGIMGPVIFTSMTTSIIALDSINDLTNLGFKIMKRFVIITVFLIVVSLSVSAFFFRSAGTESVSFAPQQLLQMVLDVIPTNLFRPFVENNTAQLVILGFLMGSALLILGDSVSELNEMLLQINSWMMSAMKIVLMAVPAIPFLSIFTALAKGNGDAILTGWKFIVASYLVFTFCAAFKLVKSSIVTGIGITEFWRRIKPIVKMSFSTASTTAPIKKVYETSEEDFAIKPEFTSFWIPMCSAMLSPSTTINVVLATCMVAEMTGIAVSSSFLLVLTLVTMELSIASPGTTSAWAIMFETLSMPSSYVGLFSVYRMLTVNIGAACTEAYAMCEEVEAAYKLGGVNAVSENNADA